MEFVLRGHRSNSLLQFPGGEEEDEEGERKKKKEEEEKEKQEEERRKREESEGEENKGGIRMGGMRTKKERWEGFWSETQVRCR